jgi:hypothetical protein
MLSKHLPLSLSSASDGAYFHTLTKNFPEVVLLGPREGDMT